MENNRMFQSAYGILVDYLQEATINSLIKSFIKQNVILLSKTHRGREEKKYTTNTAISRLYCAECQLY